MSPKHRASGSSTASRAANLPPWGAVCFFVSGAAGLLYEVVWSKQLSYQLGNSLHAVATVVSAFLCGLALGARFVGPRLGRWGRGARVYGALEFGVAVLGVISLPLLRGLDPLVGVLYRTLSGESPAFAVARVALMFAVLVPPAALMGATLPVLVSHLERVRVGPMMARLYAVNTFGAVAGTIAGGFALLPTVGLTVTTWVAAGLNVTAGLIAWWMPARSDDREGQAAIPGADPPSLDALGRRTRMAVAVLFLLSGFAALAFQIVWVRIFTLVFGSSVYSFSAVLGIYLLGIAIGSACIAPRLRLGASLATFGLLQLGIAAAAALQLIAFSHLPEWLYQLAERSGAHWSMLFACEVGVIAAFLIVPCALLGAAFPLATALLQRRDPGQATGLAYAVNTLGTVAGSLVVGFYSIPTWGAQVTHVFTLCLVGAIGIAATWLAHARREVVGRHLTLAAATFAAIVWLAFTAPRWDPSLMSIGAFRPIQALNAARAAASLPGNESVVRRVAKSERVLYYAEGINGSVLVGTRGDGRERWLRVDGKVDASLGRDMVTQVMLGLIPTICADSGGSALVIGLGSGFTLSAVLAAGAGATEVVELEPRVVDASRFFHTPGHDPLDDPRVHLVLGDARTRLACGDARYDVIVSEPSNPWLAGVNNLFTVDFYRRARVHLAPRGVFCQWVQLYELSQGTLASLLASFLEVFPEGEAYRMNGGADLVLVARPPVCRMALERLRSPEVQRVLERVGALSPESIAGYYIASLSSLRGWVAHATLNRDDLPIVEYRAPRDLVTMGRAHAVVSLPREMLPPVDLRPEGILFSAWSPESWFESRTVTLVQEDDLDGAAATARAASAAGYTRLGQRLSERVDASSRRARSLAAAEQARALFSHGRDADGLQALEWAADQDPSNGRLWLWIADRRRLAKDFTGAEAGLARGRATRDTSIRADAALIAGMMEVDRRRPLTAAKRFRELQHLNPMGADGYFYEACARAAGGDSAGARDAVHRGLERLPGEQRLSVLLGALE